MVPDTVPYTIIYTVISPSTINSGSTWRHLYGIIIKPLDETEREWWTKWDSTTILTSSFNLSFKSRYLRHVWLQKGPNCSMGFSQEFKSSISAKCLLTLPTASMLIFNAPNLWWGVSWLWHANSGQCGHTSRTKSRAPDNERCWDCWTCESFRECVSITRSSSLLAEFTWRVKRHATST